MEPKVSPDVHVNQIAFSQAVTSPGQLCRELRAVGADRF